MVGPHVPFLGALAVLALLAGLPLFQFKLMSGHDALAYGIRHRDAANTEHGEHVVCARFAAP